MSVVLFDSGKRKSLYPFTYTKAVAALFFGMLTIKDRWHHMLQQDVFIETEPYLQGLYNAVPAGDHTWINASVLPGESIISSIQNLKQGDVLEDGNGIIACCGRGGSLKEAMENSAINFSVVTDVRWLQHPHQMIHINDEFLRFDMALITRGKISQIASQSNRCIATENMFIEGGTSIECAIINAQSGPVYIGKNATILEGSLIKGPAYIGEAAVVKMGAKIYGATSIGTGATAGGEIKNSIIGSYSNKAHDGYLGDSVIGEWCNLGAGTSNSNVKNTAGDVWLRNGSEEDNPVNAGTKFGVLMGDYTRVAINSSINTGSLYGISCNVHGQGLLPTFLRSFSWGVTGEGYTIDKAIKHINQWKRFKDQSLSPVEESVLTHIFDNFMNNEV